MNYPITLTNSLDESALLEDKLACGGIKQTTSEKTSETHVPRRYREISGSTLFTS